MHWLEPEAVEAQILFAESVLETVKLDEPAIMERSLEMLPARFQVHGTLRVFSAWLVPTSLGDGKIRHAHRLPRALTG